MLEEYKNAQEEGKFCEEIKKRLEWQYHYRLSSRIPTKVTVSELKRRFATEFSGEYSPPEVYVASIVKKPSFLEAARVMNAAEKGTVLHFFMQHLDLERVSKVLYGGRGNASMQEIADMQLFEELEYQINGMVSGELLTIKQGESIDVQKVHRFLVSPVGRRLMKAEYVRREVPFNIELPSTEVHKGLPVDVYGDEMLLLQGVIDCCFEEENQLVLLDYKTDYVPDGGTDIIKERYMIQIKYYASALEKITGKRVKEKYIYLFWNGELVGY